MDFNKARRMAMKAIIGSPIAAKAVVDAAASEALGLSVGQPLGVSDATPSLAPQDPLWDLWDRHRRAHLARAQTRSFSECQHYMPINVATKRSWSPAYKHHCAVQEMRERQAWETFEPADQIRMLVKIGVLPKSLLK